MSSKEVDKGISGVELLISHCKARPSFRMLFQDGNQPVGLVFFVTSKKVIATWEFFTFQS